MHFNKLILIKERERDVAKRLLVQITITFQHSSSGTTFDFMFHGHVYSAVQTELVISVKMSF
jgi:hypothetical protein